MQVTLTNPELQSVLGEMNDACWSVCRGVCNYSQYKSSIGYDIKRVKLACWPPDTARDNDCAI